MSNKDYWPIGGVIEERRREKEKVNVIKTGKIKATEDKSKNQRKNRTKGTKHEEKTNEREGRIVGKKQETRRGRQK